MYFAIRDFYSDKEGIADDRVLLGKKVVVQGIGRVGSHTAKFLQRQGAIVVGVSDSTGSIYNPNGLDVSQVLLHRQTKKTLMGYPDAQVSLRDPKELLKVDCDILILSALENQINAQNVHEVGAKVIVEGANMPISADAYEVLKKNGQEVIPDIYVNSGGIIASYFEWLKNLGHVQFGRMTRRAEQNYKREMVDAITELSGKKKLSDLEYLVLTSGSGEIDYVYSGLEGVMHETWETLKQVKEKHNVDLRTAAYISAIENVASSYNEVGVWP